MALDLSIRLRGYTVKDNSQKETTMSLRVFKATVKNLNAADQDARQLVDSAQMDDEQLGHPGASPLHDYAIDALAQAYALYKRAKRAQHKLHPGQRVIPVPATVH